MEEPKGPRTGPATSRQPARRMAGRTQDKTLTTREIVMSLPAQAPKARAKHQPINPDEERKPEPCQP